MLPKLDQSSWSFIMKSRHCEESVLSLPCASVCPDLKLSSSVCPALSLCLQSQGVWDKSLRHPLLPGGWKSIWAVPHLWVRWLCHFPHQVYLSLLHFHSDTDARTITSTPLAALYFCPSPLHPWCFHPCFCFFGFMAYRSKFGLVSFLFTFLISRLMVPARAVNGMSFPHL